ncbi:MAG: hypothetical protein KDE47_06620 [Caldilineaceae bacterium]|nr:hypothetical protein [Caldilineaceae bacterium]
MLYTSLSAIYDTSTEHILPDQSRNGNSVVAYGAPELVGEAREPCDDETTVAHATILHPEDAWEQLLHQAKAGDVFLLQKGIYQAEDKLWLPAGSANAPITIKPYACATVTIRSSIRPHSYNIIAGVRLEAVGIDDTQWAIRIDGKNRAPLTEIVVRNNTIRGGTIDAIRVNDDVRNVTIDGNSIDGGSQGHDIFITSSPPNSQTTEGPTLSILPDDITISHNRLTKRYFSSASEDMFQVRDVGIITFTHNTCADGLNMEQCVDIKTTTVPIRITHNLFAGDTLHQTGRGEDGAGGCMVIHESDAVADQHLIEHNFFYHCQGTVIRFSPGEGDTRSSALFQSNVLVQAPHETQIIPIETATNLHFRQNTVIFGKLKLGNSDRTRLPTALLFQHNIFYQTEIEDHLPPSTAAYICAYNLLYQLQGDGFTAAPCSATITDDPLFVSVDLEDFHLQSISPALGSGEAGATLGALPTATPPIALDQRLFLPLILSPTQ